MIPDAEIRERCLAAIAGCATDPDGPWAEVLLPETDSLSGMDQKLYALKALGFTLHCAGTLVHTLAEGSGTSVPVAARVTVEALRDATGFGDET